SGSEGDGYEKTSSRRAGKEEMPGKIKKKYKIKTSGKFEIREGEGGMEPESESENDLTPLRPLGETSRFGLEFDLSDVFDKIVMAIKKDFTESILAVFNKYTQANHDSQALTEAPVPQSPDHVSPAAQTEKDLAVAAEKGPVSEKEPTVGGK